MKKQAGTREAVIVETILILLKGKHKMSQEPINKEEVKELSDADLEVVSGGYFYVPWWWWAVPNGPLPPSFGPGGPHHIGL